jgi:FkbM family methyltransferase
MHNGIKINLGSYHGQWMTELIKRLRGCHEPQEEKIFYEVLNEMPEGGVMLELGSYWAYYSLWFHLAVDRAENHMIEPNPTNIEMGKKNFAINNMEGVFTNAFIGAQSKPEAPFTDWNGTTVSLPMVCVDDYLEQHDIRYLHILHADVQGAELDMLYGCERTIARNGIGFIFISTHDDKHNICLDFLRERNFRIIAEHTIEESYSADGLIVACSAAQPHPVAVRISKRTGWRRLRSCLRTLRESLRGLLAKIGLLGR